MNYLKITISLLGIILVIVGAIMAIRFSSLKKNGFKNFYTYFQSNINGSRKARTGGYLLISGLLLIVISAKIKD